MAAAALRPLVDPARALETHPHAAPDRWLVENPGFVSGGSTRWLADAVLGVPEAQLFALAAEAPPGSDGLVFVPALGGAVTPRWNDRARGTFHGLRLGHDRRHLCRAVLEGCAFALRDIVEGLDALGLAGDRIRVLGGGARDPLWMSIKSDVTGCVVERLAEPEATAYGAALLAATGIGWFPDAAAAARTTVAVLPRVDVPDAGATSCIPTRTIGIDASTTPSSPSIWAPPDRPDQASRPAATRPVRMRARSASSTLSSGGRTMVLGIQPIIERASLVRAR